jgi:hypothetical protein
VLTIRCTRELLERLDVEASSVPLHLTNCLCDWYANLLFTGRARLIICTSERTLLPVFVEAGTPSSFIPRFQEAVRTVLGRIGSTSGSLNSEARAMAQISIGTTASGRVLGSLNDLASLARFKIADHPAIDLGTLAVDLADTPCAPLNYETPKSVSVTLLRRISS